ncbi:DUF6584 family protein [Streptomyces sp. NPDC087908]|uniref:DUF6584 family protein n=1 Tax=Streptomyces sp. NPDC087908 TaxID=3365820 RepID=UPI0037F79AEA
MRQMKALAWRGPEALASPVSAEERLIAPRTARAEELGRPVDWDDPASYRDDPEETYEEAPSAPWTVGGVLARGGCLVGATAFLTIWVNGVVALFR